MSNNTFNEGKVHVCREMCSTCIFRPGNKMDLNPGRVAQMLQEACSQPEGSITCHCTLGGAQQAVCRGFWDKHKTPLLQLAERLEMVEEITPPSLSEWMCDDNLDDEEQP